jgi:uncharacterized protein (TIGR02996 family)
MEINHPEHDAFVAAMHMMPHDSLPYLTYADWLQERGHDEMADKIRFVVEHQGDGPLWAEKWKPWHEDTGEGQRLGWVLQDNGMATQWTKRHMTPGVEVSPNPSPFIAFSSPKHLVKLIHPEPSHKFLEEYHRLHDAEKHEEAKRPLHQLAYHLTHFADRGVLGKALLKALHEGEYWPTLYSASRGLMPSESSLNPYNPNFGHVQEPGSFTGGRGVGFQTKRDPHGE